jgi:transposase
MHLEWIRKQTFEHEAQSRVLREYLHSVDGATSQIARLTQDIEELVHEHELSPLVTNLQALKGFQLITAAGVAVEIGDLQRFHNPCQLMAYLGLVPSEHSTGEGKRRGGDHQDWQQARAPAPCRSCVELPALPQEELRDEETLGRAIA